MTGSSAPAGWFPDPQSPGNQRYWDGHQWTEQRIQAVVPAGWYPDTTTPGQLRYWDGRAWTEHVSPAAGPAVSAAAASATTAHPAPEYVAGPGVVTSGDGPDDDSPKDKRPIWQRWWFLTAAALIVVIIVIAITGGGDPKADPTKSPSASTPVSTPASAVTTPSSEPTSAAPTPASTPTPTPTPTIKAPTVKPTPTEKPAPPPPSYKTFGDGSQQVPQDVKPGTYRTRSGSEGCYWQRLKGFGGALDDILATENTDGPAVVTIKSGDKGFESSNCGTWTSDLSAVTSNRTSFGEGTFIVGVDIKAGTYKSSGTDSCYWQRMKGFGGGLDSIIANDNVEKPTIVSIKSGDTSFESTRCGTWTKIG